MVCGKSRMAASHKGAFLQWSKAETEGRNPGQSPKIVSRQLQPNEDSQGAARGSSVGARKPGSMVLSALGTHSRPGCQEGAAATVCALACSFAHHG